MGTRNLSINIELTASNGILLEQGRSDQETLGFLNPSFSSYRCLPY